MRIKRLLGCSETPVTSQLASVAVLAILVISAAAIVGRYAYAEVKSDTPTEPSSRGAQPEAPTTVSATVGTTPSVTSPGTQQLLDEARQIEVMESDLEKQIQNREDLARQVDEQARNLQAAMMMQDQVGNPSQSTADEEKRIAEAKRQVHEALDRLNSPEFRKQLDEAREQAARINSPEFRKQVEQARAQMQKLDSAELRNQLDQAQAEMKRLNSPEFRKQLDEAIKSAQQNRELSQKLQEKLNSAEYKSQIAEARAAASKVDSEQIRRSVDDAMKQMQILQSSLADQKIARAEAPPAPPAETSEPPSHNGGAAAPNGPVRVSSGVMAHSVISQPPPVYPAEAKAAHIQGTVVLKATISKTGDVQDLRVVSGPPELMKSAIDAVKQWKYKPYLLNGEPVEVDTTINVNYTFGGPGPSSELDGVPIRHVGGAVSSPELIFKRDPEFTADAKQAKSNRIVLVSMVVNSNGLPEDMHVVRSAGSELDEKALDAVRQYRFKPAMEAGQPVPVDLKVEVNFQVF